MKKRIATLMLVALIAVSALLVLAACGPQDKEPRANANENYVITGNFNGWKVNVTEENKLDSKYQMEAVKIQDERIESIKESIVDAKYIYVVEHTATNNKKEDGSWESGWSIKYATSEGAEPIEVDGNMAIKVIGTHEETAAGVTTWTSAWLPDAGNTVFKSLTPDTLYMPPHSEKAQWENSGAWNDNPILLKAGTYTIVFVEFNDGTYGLGAIAK